MIQFKISVRPVRWLPCRPFLYDHDTFDYKDPKIPLQTLCYEASNAFMIGIDTIRHYLSSILDDGVLYSRKDKREGKSMGKIANLRKDAGWKGTCNLRAFRAGREARYRMNGIFSGVCTHGVPCSTIAPIYTPGERALVKEDMLGRLDYVIYTDESYIYKYHDTKKAWVKKGRGEKKRCKVQGRKVDFASCNDEGRSDPGRKSPSQIRWK